MEPEWTYTDSQINIEGLVVAPDGSAVVAGTGKVLLLSQNGSVLAKEPYGEVVAMSRDGFTIVTGYSSVVSSTIYVFKIVKDPSGILSLKKQWESTLPDRINSLSISDNGARIAFSVGGTGIYVYDGKTGKRIGYSKEYSSIITMSGRGNAIAGISMVQGLKAYNPTGTIRKKYDIALPGEPAHLLMDTNGSVVVFNGGPHIIAFNLSSGTEAWERTSASDINMLAMMPSGKYFVAGTENGTVDYYDSNGNLNWTYYSNSGTGSGQAIEAVAMTRDGSKIIAGSSDGKIILLDSDGNLIWKFTTVRDPVRRVTIAADGSLAIAASETTIYAFSTGKQSSQPKSIKTTIKTTSPTVSSAPSSATSPEALTMTPGESISTQHSIIPVTPSITVTEYSIVRTAKQSLLEITAIAALIVTIFLVRSR
jgi:WD40 repeat protein